MEWNRKHVSRHQTHIRVPNIKTPFFYQTFETNSFFGMFTKLEKETVSFVMSACLFARVEQLSSHWMDFHEIWYLSIFRNSVKKIQISLKSTRITGTYIKTYDNKGYFT
jgi:hypothetical protein